MQAIQIALKFSDGGMKPLEEMTADPLVRPGPWSGNRAMWIAGHLAVIEGACTRCFAARQVAFKGLAFSVGALFYPLRLNFGGRVARG
ncbi:MAG: hypothetical protein M1541_09335 [Acidobacteria bacterium]|nr:hypothetical protein [Acidobacteriota bacterium]